LRRARLGVAKALTEATGGSSHFVQLTQHLELGGLGRGSLLLSTGAKEQPRICQEPLTDFRRAAQEGRAQLAHVAAAQPRCGGRLGQAQAVLAAAAGDRQQVPHRRMGRDRAEAHMLLDLCRKIADQAQMPRDPAHALVHPLGQFLGAQSLTAQRGQQPALLDRRGSRRAPLAAVQQQGVSVLEVPQRRPDGVGTQALETAKTLEAVDDQIRALRLHHDDWHLLALLAERGQQAALALGAMQAQVLVAAIELVKFQVHGAPPLRRRQGAATGIA
jgi:hypothetical protein